MVERGEDIEKSATESLIDQKMKTIINLTERSLEEFKGTMQKCDFYNSLKAYMNIEHFLQEGKSSTYELMNVDKGRGEAALRDVEALEQRAYQMSENLAKNCRCEQREAFKYVEKLPKE